MKRILITLRHPGPVQSIAAILPYLETQYQVIIVATDAGLSTLIMRFRKQVEKIKIYFLYNNQWKLYSKRCEEWKNADKAEFDLEDARINQLWNRVVELIKFIHPDVVIRTTPTIKIGIDEIVMDVCGRISQDIRCLCYQEDYGCGINLGSVPNPIAVVDRYAQKLLEDKAIKSVVVGWIGQSIYRYYKPYIIARSLARKKLGIYDFERVVLYSVGASSSFGLDLEHFNTVLNQISKCKLYYKFHPRNTKHQRKIIQNMAKNKAIMLPETISYDEAISFPDFILSVASVLNQDSLQYQIECHEEKLSTISVYTKGTVSSKILKSTIGVSELPHIRTGMGSVIISEENISDNAFTFENVHPESLFFEAKVRFGMKEKERLDNLINYIEGDQR